jgi:hypothetical protein
MKLNEQLEMRKEIMAVRNMYMGYGIQLIQTEEGNFGGFDKYAVELVYGDRYVGTFSSGCIGQKSGEYWMEYWTKWMKRLLHLCNSINMANEQAELEMLQDWFKELIERQGDSCKFLLNEFSEYLELKGGRQMKVNSNGLTVAQMEREYEDKHNKLIWDRAEKVLDETLTEDEFKAMLHDWKVFSRNPEHYSGTIVVDVVKSWLNDRRITNKQ